MSEDRFAVTRTVTLKKGGGRSLKAGGLWVYDNEIDTVVGGGENGALAAVKDFDGYPTFSSISMSFESGTCLIMTAIFTVPPCSRCSVSYPGQRPS